MDQTYELVLSGGHVVDPATGVDAVRDVGIDGGTISAVSPDRLRGRRVIDLTGLTLTPGFIDMHSHAQTVAGMRLQALDGVTTSLELEAGAAPVAEAYARAAQDGRPINYGYSASWALTRMRLFDDLAIRRPEFPMGAYSQGQTGRRWSQPLDRDDLNRLLGALEHELEGGALGIGVLLGYAVATSRREYLEVARLAARFGVPTFTHTRYLAPDEPGSSVEGALEVVAAAASTGAHMHMCHLNSTSNRSIDVVAAMIENAQGYGLRITTEAYPYGSAATVANAPFLGPEQLRALGMTSRDVLYLPTGERPETMARWQELRENDPGGMVVFDWLDESDPADFALLQRSLLMPDSAIASDAVPLVDLRSRALADDRWPALDGVTTHPRSLNCFARTFRWLVRDARVLTLMEAVRRCTLLPAELLADASPAMRNKGRIAVGADADLVAFDLDAIGDPATALSPRASTGFTHVIVGGTSVVLDGQVQVDAMPGRGIRGGD